MFNISNAHVSVLGMLIMSTSSPVMAVQPQTDNPQRYNYEEAYQLPELGTPLLLADAKPAAKKAKPGAAPSAECQAFSKDPNADLGAVLKAGCEPTLKQMSALMDNPLGNVAMLITQFDTTRLENPTINKEASQTVYMGIAQFPKKLNPEWNLINRFIWTVPSVPLDQDKINDYDISLGPGGGLLPPGSGLLPPIDLFEGRTTGFGDMFYVGLFSPSKPIDVEGGGKIVWGAGFDIGLPTATEDILGTGRWTGGPSLLGVYLGPKWKVGALATQYWDFAGDNDRGSVNMTNLQYFMFYSIDDVSSIGAAPNIICNWEQTNDNRCTIPIGIGYNTTVQMGKVPVRMGIEVHYSVVQPDDIPGSAWNVRVFFIPGVPSALFDWMQ
ncbi:MAG TPA: hypothetical protein ENI64_12975 [Gammaproteobacteria bacterium]|nr:hypothetical protein [Gammaproteobacteria bacterium]